MKTSDITIKHGKYRVVVTAIRLTRHSPGWGSEWYEARGTVNGKPFFAESAYGFDRWSLPRKGGIGKLPRSLSYRTAVARASRAAYEQFAQTYYPLPLRPTLRERRRQEMGRW